MRSVVLLACAALTADARPAPAEVPPPPPGWVCSGPVVGAGALVAEYRADLEDGWLADPRHLLTGRQARELAEFLDYHAADSSIPIRVALFQEHEEVPAGLGGSGSGAPVLRIDYFLGRPERARLRLQPAVPGLERQVERALREAVEMASRQGHPAEALHAFCVQAAVRAFSIEQRLAGGPVTVREERIDAADLSPGRHRSGRPGPWLAWAALGTLPVAGWLWLRSRPRRFPEIEVEPRLGAPHAAGIGAVISFGDTTQSPGRQKGEPDDLLGGI